MAATFFAFIGAKGGAGTTTVCLELAKAMREEANVTLVDADLSGRRSAAILLDALRYLDAARDDRAHIAQARVDGVTLAEVAESYESSFTLGVDEVETFASTLTSGIVLVDAPLPFSATVRPFIVRATRFLIVAEPTVLSVAAARTLANHLRHFGVPPNRIALVLNARSSDGSLSRSDVEGAVGVPVLAELPSIDDRGFGRAIGSLQRDLRKISPEKFLESLTASDSGEVRDRRVHKRTSAESAPSTVTPLAAARSKAGRSVTETARDRLKSQVHDALAKNIDLLDASKAQGDSAKLAELRSKVSELTQMLLSTSAASESAETIAQLKAEIVNEALGLGPLEDFMHDPDLTEIMVNGADEIYVEISGRIHKTPKHFADERQLRLIIERIINPLGRRLDESSPMVDARLPDGSRVNAIIEPLSLNGPTLTIRRFGTRRLGIEDLLQKESANEPLLDFLRACVEARLNLVISGGTGSGKTTFLNILSGYLPESERIITIEDAAELCLNQPHVVRLESRPANLEGRGQVSIRDLVRNALRMRPDRIVVGECRGAEALDMLQAMNTGHDGSLTTIHANSARDALARIETMVLMAGFDLPVRAIREQVASAIDVVIQTARLRDGSRKVTGVSEIVGMEGDIVTMQEIMRYAQHGVDENKRVIGEFQYTGVQPKALKRFEEYGVSYDPRALSGLRLAASSW
jgi:Flp pilus assembly CpaF family ATPase/MinD-like ATPase involved in chromosome partitioning or flagellar assembly